jgi:hypothetical protein
MIGVSRRLHQLSLLVGGAMLLALPLAAQSGDVLPEVPKGKGEVCVEPTDVMRRDHMKFILHQRDETMHRGIRTEKYSLDECIECHVQPGPDGKIARIDSPDHFCNSCHTYAAVKIDCFDCHADRPVANVRFHPLTGRALPAHAARGAGDTELSKETVDVLVMGGESQ